VRQLQRLCQQVLPPWRATPASACTARLGSPWQHTLLQGGFKGREEVQGRSCSLLGLDVASSVMRDAVHSGSLLFR
jgi:hypothetical protein